jgi:hypothetical protein
MDPVLARAAGIVAEIHHSHGIKAALAVGHLRARFPHWTDAFWHEALTRARWFEETVVDGPMALSGSQVRPERARIVLARAVLPRCYSATRSWAAASGADAIVRFYLVQATAEPGYLGHRLSILLALGQAWTIYKDGPHRDLYLDRLTEFILACQFKGESGVATAGRAAGWAEACTAALARPGFFGHHLISLAWIGRCRGMLSERQLQSSLGWVVEATATTYPDADDNVTVSAATGQELTEAALESELRDLLLRGVRNIHLLTLADAIAWLWDQDEGARPFLVSVARLSIDGAAA